VTPPVVAILSDEDVRSLLSMAEAIELIEDAIRLKGTKSLVTPPRFYAGNSHGALVFTVGGHADRGAFGFRVYGMFPGRVRDEQFVAVFDSETGSLKGLVFGELIAAIRTGAIGGVAIKHAAREDAHVVGIVGSGMQARTQLMAAAAVRDVSAAKVYSRSAENRETFATEMTESLGLPVHSVSTAEEVVAGADILITATSSAVPVFPASLIGPGVHINALGSKFAARHELDPAVADSASTVFTDSLEQLGGYPEPFFLSESHKITDLADHLASGAAIRRSPQDITLFCSVGLSGTEVVLADAVLAKAALQR
jgi:ornithine cyclodeaminase